ncbi:MAG: D-alanyl-D-alanine carboxypeptidase [Clostridiales bacterium]|nr:D-alanyl-D-alanine carboxypeptidase [Clostridiales bacterium]
MKLRRLMGSLLVTAVTVLSVIPFIGGSALAVVNQPDITITPLEDIHCAAYCVYDKTADTILLEQQSHNRVYPASMTKIMTFQLGLDYLDPDDYVTVSQNAIDNVTSDSTLMYLAVGEEVKVSELYYGMMLPSGNDAANVVAEAVIKALIENYPEDGEVGPDGVNASYFTSLLGVSAEEIVTDYPLSAFAELMSLRARNLGCTGTHFVNANGLHSDEHYTTAYDLCLIMAHATENPDFNTVISSPTHVFQATNVHTQDAWSIVRNTNQLLSDPWMASKTAEGEDTHISAFIGGKTGTTSMAGTGMTTYSVNENGHELMIAVCGIPYEEYSHQTEYVTSAVAYGNLACWNSDPVTVIPGNLGDYQRFNWTSDEAPVYDPLIVPGDTLPVIEGSHEEVPAETEETVPGETAGEVIISDSGEGPDVEAPGVQNSLLAGFFETRVGKFVSLNPGVSVLIVVLVLIIIVLVIILIARSIKYSRPKKRRREVRQYKGPTF